MTGEGCEDVLLEMGQEFLEKVRGKIKNGVVEDGTGYRNFRDNCIFGFSLDNGEVITTPGSYCHGYVMEPSVCFDTSTRKPVAINTRIQKDSIGYDRTAGVKDGGLLEKDYFDEYYDFLFNRSVFADCYVTKTTEGLREGGVVVVRCDRGAANLMQAANIAIRRGWEYTTMSASLVNMLRMGIEPNLAHLVSYILAVDKKGNVKNKIYGDHQSIHSQYLDKSGVKNFREGKLPPSSKYNIKTYQKCLNYRGLYGMWNDGGFRANEKGTTPLTFQGDRCRDNNKRDPFNYIVELTIKPKRTIQSVIEEGLELL